MIRSTMNALFAFVVLFTLEFTTVAAHETKPVVELRNDSPLCQR